MSVCMYYKEHLPIIKTDGLCTLEQCLFAEIIVDKKSYFLCLYRSPSQTQDELEEFCNDLNSLLSNVNDVNVSLSVTTGDFNGVSLDKENVEGH